jgi:(p)ppGpp synthase/HD superfamily hydrolase
MVSMIIEQARVIAYQAHFGQRDKAGLPYYDHPARVAADLRASDQPDVVVAAAFLHDVIEDTHWTADHLLVFFPPEVVQAVESVSRQEGQTYFDMIRQARGNKIGRLVKLADNADNSDEKRLSYLEKDEADFLRKRYAKARLILLGKED